MRHLTNDTSPGTINHKVLARQLTVATESEREGSELENLSCRKP
jgi:hypothetical protein